MTEFESIFQVDEEQTLGQKIKVLEALVEDNNERNFASTIDRELKKITKKTYVGDGSTGDAVFNGTDAVSGCSLSGTTYTLTTDVYYDNVDVADGVTILGRQYYFFVKGNLINRGSIYANGGWW